MGLGYHVWWNTVQDEFLPLYHSGDQFAVYEACFLPSSRILLTVEGVTNNLRFVSYTASTGSDPTRAHVTQFLSRYPFGAITNVILQTPSSTNAVVLFIDHEGRTNVVSWRLGRGWEDPSNWRLTEANRKLDFIRFDTVSYKDLPLIEVIRNLNGEAKSRDPEKRGVNLFIDRDSSSAVSIKIDPPVHDRTLREVLDLVVRMADQPIEYSINYNTVIFGFAPAASAKAGITNTVP
jgi:hypothetical protein